MRFVLELILCFFRMYFEIFLQPLWFSFLWFLPHRSLLEYHFLNFPHRGIINWSVIKLCHVYKHLVKVREFCRFTRVSWVGEVSVLLGIFFFSNQLWSRNKSWRCFSSVRVTVEGYACVVFQSWYRLLDRKQGWHFVCKMYLHGTYEIHII